MVNGSWKRSLRKESRLAVEVARTQGSVNGLSSLEPESILSELLDLEPGLNEEAYYSERALFYNPGRVAPLGVIFAAIKDHDGPNDKKSKLSRGGVFRFAFQLPLRNYEDRFGRVPPRPAKGKFVEIEHDPSVLDELTPHPVYAWMRWVQVLSPTGRTFDSLLPSLEESLMSVRARWSMRFGSR